jgi:manganese oxidase
MSDNTFTRRGFLASSGLALGATLISQRAFAKSPDRSGNSKDFTSYSRYSPSYGGPPDSDHYLGKLTPGLRKSGLTPVPFVAPDLEKLSWKMVGGVKEFHIRCTASKREFLPGYEMNVWGYNGSMPGPTIEAVQGDRVRFVVHNELPEPTTIHWHGLELPVNMDGVPGMTQKPIPPGKTFVYEYDLHQTGTFFYHAHFAMQESMGMVGFFIIHPRIAHDPPVDRDFGLLYQNFFIRPNADSIDTMMMDWNWHTVNGRSGPYTTPMVVKHGERVRLRLLNFSPMQHHPIHLHGHTFWLTGTEGGRIPKSAWIPRNNTIVGVATAQEFEFIAFNPGDWIFHCHMFHHMMNHMVKQVGPRIRPGSNLGDYYASLPDRPEAVDVVAQPSFQVPGYPQNMQGMMMGQSMSEETMSRINNRREARGMLPDWSQPVKGLTTVIRVLPEDLYNRVMLSDESIKPGEIFNAIVGRKT